MSDKNLVSRLFEAGAHFGFKKARRHPTAAPFLYTTKEGSDVIDLAKTSELLIAAKATLKEAGSMGKTVLFVGTKDEAAKIVRVAAEKAETLYVTNRWIGGMLTNFTEIKKRINRLEELTNEKTTGELDRKYTKKERVVIGREAAKLEFNFFGISKMTRMPDLLLVVDPRHDSIAVAEATEKRIPIMAIMSTDGDASMIKYPVVANDALQTSVSLIMEELTAAYIEGKSAFVPKEVAPVGNTRRRAA
jgi:small subunit ribosomal protein S2